MKPIILPSVIYNSLFNKPKVLRLIESILTSVVSLGLAITAIVAPNSLYGKHLLLWKVFATIATFRSIWLMSFFNPKHSLEYKNNHK